MMYLLVYKMYGMYIMGITLRLYQNYSIRIIIKNKILAILNIYPYTSTHEKTLP